MPKKSTVKLGEKKQKRVSLKKVSSVKKVKKTDSGKDVKVKKDSKAPVKKTFKTKTSDAFSIKTKKVSSPENESSVSEKKIQEEKTFDILGDLTETADLDKAEIYDELIAQEMEREIIRSQRKQTAGKEAAKKEGRKSETVQQVLSVKDRIVEIPEVISVKEFAEKTGVGAAKVIGELMRNGVLANINQQIDYDTAQIVASDLGIRIKKKITVASAQDVFSGNLEALLKEEDSENLQPRPPIVVIMGHVDHGKTTLLDFIRQTHVAAKESGGITQHIGAYQVEKNGKKITFLDTPGHEAFTAMRARGAKVTDIAILVVAADEGIKPQTIEAIQHAQEAHVPIIVAINKIDKEGAAPERVKGELGEYGLVPEDWGGKTIMVHVSAKTGEGIPQLLEMILLVSDLENFKANPLRAAVGTVIEAHLDQNLGPVASVIVNSGMLQIMDNLVIGGTYGRVKVMKDYLGKPLRKAEPSTPVFIAGLAETPQSGDVFQVVSNEKAAREQALKVKTLKEADLLAKRGVGGIISQISSGQLKQLKLVLKADTKGSLEALRQSLSQIENQDVGVKVILSGVGNITESDVMMAAAGQGIVMGFHVEVHANVRKIAEREGVEVLSYTVIYKLLDDIRKILTGLLEPEEIEVILGKAEVKRIFLTKKKEMIIGCKVIQGHIEKVKLRIFRKEEKVGEGQVVSLKKVDLTVHEVHEGNECGILYTGFLPLQEGDILEAYKKEKRVRTL